MRQDGAITLTAGEALARHRLVKLDSTARQVIYADAGEEAIGVTRASAKSGAAVAIWLLNKEGTTTCVASGAISAHAKVYTDADGKVTATAGGKLAGVALQAASSDGEEIEVLPVASLGVPARLASNTETLSGAKTLTISDAPLQFLDPDGSNRDVNLPAEAVSDGLQFRIVNTAGGAEDLVVKDDGGSTILTITQNESGIVWCNGTTWGGLVGANT